MDQYIIYLKCNDGSGYYTGIILTSTSREVGVHPYKSRAKIFDNRSEAFSTAKNLKANFKCIILYDIQKF